MTTKSDRRRLYLASRNGGKLAELQAMLIAGGTPRFDAHLATELDPDLSWQETATTFEGNARIKAEAVRRHLTEPACVLADDSGLVVAALDGAPGVQSARYAGDDATDAQNVAKLLDAMRHVPAGQRDAKFVCTLCFLDERGMPRTFVGECHGTIALAPRGTEGFGYDPVFVVEGGQVTMAELSPAAKNAVSHRRRAFDAWRSASL